jgi:hypothetical protein
MSSHNREILNVPSIVIYPEYFNAMRFSPKLFTHLLLLVLLLNKLGKSSAIKLTIKESGRKEARGDYPLGVGIIIEVFALAECNR